jgi:hypothetical protein
MAQVQLLVLITPTGPIPYSYADSERGMAHQHLLAHRYRSAGLTTGHLLLRMSARRAGRWMCALRYKQQQMVISHALARIEGRTAKTFDEWFSHVA